MDKRSFIKGAVALPFLPSVRLSVSASARAEGAALRPSAARVRPGEPGWPSDADWAMLSRAVGGRLVKLRSPWDACRSDPGGAACGDLFKALKNPYFIGDQVGLTQTLGWPGAWTSRPSVYAVSAENAEDVAAAVNFARERNLRLVVKGGGHSYQGTSNAADSLLVWTRRMNAITLHDGFVPQGCAGREAPHPAVSIGAGAIWREAYDAVTTRAGRYVQGGGCLTVGVAGLVQGGGFGSFSKNFGTAAANLLEAEIVTADGVARIANACTNADLFWAIKGGGGGSFGVVTRLTLRTHDLPNVFGAVNATIEAGSDAAFRRLIGRFTDFYAESLFNPHWGEQARFRRDNRLSIQMVFQGLEQDRARAVWRTFFDWVAASPSDFKLSSPPLILGIRAGDFWNAELLMKYVPGLLTRDDRPGAPETNVFWSGNQGECGQVLHGYRSVWLPASLLETDQRERLSDALFAGSRHWQVALHFNKGLAGAPAEALAGARDTAMNPAVLDAFALAIVAGGGPPAYPGIAGHEPDVDLARREAAAIGQAMDELRRVVPEPGSYLAEGDFFDTDWQASFWGQNYSRLAAVKATFDPGGLFFVHHGVGSEGWSADGFTRLAKP